MCMCVLQVSLGGDFERFFFFFLEWGRDVPFTTEFRADVLPDA